MLDLVPNQAFVIIGPKLRERREIGTIATMEIAPERMMHLFFLALVFEAVVLGSHSLLRDRNLMASFDGHHDKKGGVSFVWQEPPGTTKPRGLLFLLHGCSHSATDFWPAGEHCEDCIGLPVEKTIVARALSQGLAVVAMSSTNREHKCWQPVEDMPGAVQVIHDMRLLMKVPKTAPNYLFGVSSGGFFAGFLGIHLNKLARERPDLRVRASCIQVAGLPGKMNSLANVEFMPSIIYVPMARDSASVEKVHESIAKFEENQVTKAKDGGFENVRKAKMQAIVAKAKPIDPNFFTLGGFLTPKESKILVEAFRRGALLDSDGLVSRDPRKYASQYATAAREALPGVYKKGGRDGLIPDLSPTMELLNMAFCVHEITTEGLDETFSLFLKT